MVNTDFVLIADPRVLAVSVIESGEPLVDLRGQTDILYGPSPEIENNQDYTWMRHSVFSKLKLAQSRLPSGLRICLYEGLRSIHLQRQLFEERWEKVKALRPNDSHEEIFNEVIQMVSPVTLLDGSLNVPPHSTGAAVDVYLVRSSDASPVDMGILAKDWMTDVTGVLSYTHSKLISEEARLHRQILSQCMEAVDFVNYPTEYWHWSYGDRYWAYMKQMPCAIFGPAKQ
jgi:D-alanyl-D-alanine dipeptidase